MKQAICPLERRSVRTPCSAALVSCVLTLGLVGCGAVAPVQQAERLFSIPLRLGWFEGRPVEYVTTDVSDGDMAREMGVNHVPLLAAAAPPAGSPPGTRTAVDLVYVFPRDEQRSVFPSAPTPTGSGNASKAYSPLWRLVMVQWSAGRARRELTSEEAVLDAVERGDVSLTRTSIVANCPIIRSTDGLALKGVR